MLAIALALAFCAAGCEGDEQRAAAHVERAEALLAEDRGKEALLELRTAAQLVPQNVDINRRVADVSLDYGYLGDAMDFFREVHFLQPDDHDTTVKLTRLLLIEEPDSAAALIDELLAANPDDHAALLLRAEASVLAGDPNSGRRDVRRARVLAPDDPEVYWALARVHEARIDAVARLETGQRVLRPLDFDAALAAYDEYWKKGGDRRVIALLNRALLLGSMPGRAKEARESYMTATRVVMEEGTYHERIQVFHHAYEYAKATSDVVTQRKVLREWISIQPDNLTGWENLANVDESEEHRDGIYDELLETQPANAAAHVLYARNLAQSRGLGAALAHLRQQIEAGLDEATLLTGLANIQFTAKRPGDVERTVAELEAKYPQHPATAVLRARQLSVAGDGEGAAAILNALIEREESVDALRFLGRVEYKRGRYEEALDAIKRARVASKSVDPDIQRLLARILAAQGQHREAIGVLRRLRSTHGLTAQDQFALARSYYAAHGAPFAREILAQILDGTDLIPEAALEYARREASNSLHRETARAYLKRALQRHPRNLDVLAALTRLDLEDDAPQRAMIRLKRRERAMPKNAELHLLLARTLIELGQYDRARQAAELVLRLDRGAANEAIGILAVLFGRFGDAGESIAALEALDRADRLDTDHLAILSQLYVGRGDTKEAIATYERALAGGSDLVVVKNDLAYLLATSGSDLPRATQLAKEAANAPGEQWEAADTLGYVYLQSGMYDAAFWQFRYVATNADPPAAEYYYHLGLALIKLERTAEAKAALKQALAINAQFSDAVEALQGLAGTRPGNGTDTS